jgi:hypothetical protein
VHHFDALRVKEAEFARKVQASIKASAASGAAGSLAGKPASGTTPTATAS